MRALRVLLTLLTPLLFCSHEAAQTNNKTSPLVRFFVKAFSPPW